MFSPSPAHSGAANEKLNIVWRSKLFCLRLRRQVLSLPFLLAP
jgi:hypothetical protein